MALKITIEHLEDSSDLVRSVFTQVFEKERLEFNKMLEDAAAKVKTLKPGEKLVYKTRPKEVVIEG